MSEQIALFTPVVADADPGDGSELRGQLALVDAWRYITAGRAIVTLESLRTEVRFTYRVRCTELGGSYDTANGGRPVKTYYFVDILAGPSNETDWSYLGVLETMSKTLRLTAKSRAGTDAGSVLAFRYFLRAIEKAWTAVDLTIWHEGRCGRCGRRLTVPESIASGIGPVCLEIMNG